MFEIVTSSVTILMIAMKRRRRKHLNNNNVTSSSYRRRRSCVHACNHIFLKTVPSLNLPLPEAHGDFGSAWGFS